MQQLNPSEISEIIKQRIEKSDVAAQARNEGTVVSVSDGIVRIFGLADVMYGEMIEFPGGVYGMALNIFAPALASFIYRVVFGVSSTLAQAPLMKTIAVPVLKDIPFLGKLLFDQTPMVYAVYLIVIITMTVVQKCADLVFKKLA